MLLIYFDCFHHIYINYLDNIQNSGYKNDFLYFITAKKCNLLLPGLAAGVLWENEF